MKRPFSLRPVSPLPLVAAGTGLIAATYGLVRLAYGLVLPEVERDLALGVAMAGVVSAGASVVYCAGALLGFLLAARHPRALVLAAALSAATGAGGMALAPTAVAFAVFAIAGSAGAGLASPALVAVLQRNPSTRRSPRAQAIVNAGTGPGLVVAGVLALVLLPDWRLGWGIAAAVTIAAAGAVLLTDRADAGDAGDARAGDARPRRPLPPASWYAAHRGVLAAALLMGVGSAAVWTYGRTVLVASGAPAPVSVAAWVALGVGGSAVIATAKGLERLGPRAAWGLTAGVIAVSSAALAVGAGSAALALAACAAFGWGYTAGSGALIAWTTQLDGPRAPAGTALLFVTLILGQALGAAAFGALIPAVGETAAFLVAAVASALAATPALLGVSRGSIPQPARR
ncbi:MFS transporter [Planctomonas deserti]|uniref:MFS transporter n=1 Tax=Planctomonas deserti TaxID=2144185 RepID=UPI000D3D91AA|nr:MFS transporter [Planctomonas deserti]